MEIGLNVCDSRRFKSTLIVQGANLLGCDDNDVVDDGDACIEDGDSEDEDQSESDEMVARDSLRCGDWPLEVFQTIWRP